MIGSFASYSHLGLAGKLRIARALAAALLGQPDRERNVRGVADAQRPRRARTRGVLGSVLHSGAQRAIRSRRGIRRDVRVKDRFSTRCRRGAFRLLKSPARAPSRGSRKKTRRRAHVDRAVLSVTPSDARPRLRSEPLRSRSRRTVTLSMSKGRRTWTSTPSYSPFRPAKSSEFSAIPQRYGVANLDQYDPYPIIDVHLWHDGGSIGRDFVAALESPLQWIFEKEPGYLCCSFSAADEYLRQPTAELEALAWREVQTFLPALKDAKLVRSAVTRNPEATWLPRVGITRTQQRTNHPAHRDRRLVDRRPAGPTPWSPRSAAATSPRTRFLAVTRAGATTERSLRRAVDWLLQANSPLRAGGRANSRPTSR